MLYILKTQLLQNVTPFNYWIRTILFRPSSIILFLKKNSKDSFFLSLFLIIIHLRFFI